MATSVVPALIDALVTQCRTALPTVDVFDGPNRACYDIGSYLMIGCDTLPDPVDDGTWAVAAEPVQSPFALATTRPQQEDGVVHCIALAWDGGGDFKVARDAVYAMTAAVENLIRTAGKPTPFFGVTGVFRLTFGTTSTPLQQQQTEQGVVAYLTFSLSFSALI